MNCPRCNSRARFIGYQPLAKRVDGRLTDFGKVRLYNCTNPNCDTSFIHPGDKPLVDAFHSKK